MAANLEALGMIETKGLVALIEASDAMLKAANVTFIGWQKIGSGLVTAMVVGDVAAGLDDEIGGRGGEQRLGHHQHAHDVERRADEPFEELQASDRLAGHGALWNVRISVRVGRHILLQIAPRFRARFATKIDGNSVALRRRFHVSK